GSGVNELDSIFGSARQSTTFDRGLIPGIQLKDTPIDFGQTRLAVQSAQADVRGATAALDLERVDLAFTVTNDFYSLLRAQSLAGLSVQQVQQANEQLQLVLGKIAAGAEATVNRYQFDVALANAQVTLLQNQNAVRQDAAAPAGFHHHRLPQRESQRGAEPVGLDGADGDLDADLGCRRHPGPRAGGARRPQPGRGAGHPDPHRPQQPGPAGGAQHPERQRAARCQPGGGRRCGAEPGGRECPLSTGAR